MLSELVVRGEDDIYSGWIGEGLPYDFTDDVIGQVFVLFNLLGEYLSSFLDIIAVSVISA